MADLSLIPDADWREAERRAAVIRPLTELERRPNRPSRQLDSGGGNTAQDFDTSLQSTLENDTFEPLAKLRRREEFSA
jgi:hypothetical protein